MTWINFQEMKDYTKWLIIHNTTANKLSKKIDLQEEKNKLIL